MTIPFILNNLMYVLIGMLAMAYLMIGLFTAIAMSQLDQTSHSPNWPLIFIWPYAIYKETFK